MHRSSLLLGGLLLLATARFAAAEEAVPSSSSAEGITEREFLALGDEDHPARRALRAEAAGAIGERRAPRTRNPAVEFEREAPDGSAAQSTVTLSWRPPLDGRRGLANRAAEAGAASAERTLAWRELELRAEWRSLYARWVLAVQKEELFAQLGEHVDRLRERVEVRTETGEESVLDLRRLEFAAAEVGAERALARADLVHVRAELRVHFPELDLRRMPERPGLPVPPADLRAHRADLAAAEHDVERADAERRLAGRVLEFPTLVGGWTQFEEGGPGDGPVFGVEWTVPLFDRAQGERERARVAAEAARAKLELQRREVAAGFDADLESYAILREEALHGDAWTSASAAVVEGAAAEFRAGEAGVTDFLETVRSVVGGRLAALELYQEALAAHRHLETSVGRPLTEGGAK